VVDETFKPIPPIPMNAIAEFEDDLARAFDAQCDVSAAFRDVDRPGARTATGVVLAVDTAYTRAVQRVIGRDGLMHLTLNQDDAGSIPASPTNLEVADGSVTERQMYPPFKRRQRGFDSHRSHHFRGNRPTE
jgi:hypothetical protein